MTRKDKILNCFLTHELLSNKYEINLDEMPKSLSEALTSDKPIIMAIALIVEALDGPSSQFTTDSSLRIKITQYLNEVL
jgi:hypothetical protein